MCSFGSRVAAYTPERGPVTPVVDTETRVVELVSSSTQTRREEATDLTARKGQEKQSGDGIHHSRYEAGLKCPTSTPLVSRKTITTVTACGTVSPLPSPLPSVRPQPAPVDRSYLEMERKRLKRVRRRKGKKPNIAPSLLRLRAKNITQNQQQWLSDLNRQRKGRGKKTKNIDQQHSSSPIAMEKNRCNSSSRSGGSYEKNHHSTTNELGSRAAPGPVQVSIPMPMPLPTQTQGQRRPRIRGVQTYAPADKKDRRKVCGNRVKGEKVEPPRDVAEPSNRLEQSASTITATIHDNNNNDDTSNHHDGVLNTSGRHRKQVYSKRPFSSSIAPSLKEHLHLQKNMLSRLSPHTRTTGAGNKLNNSKGRNGDHDNI